MPDRQTQNPTSRSDETGSQTPRADSGREIGAGAMSDHGSPRKPCLCGCGELVDPGPYGRRYVDLEHKRAFEHRARKPRAPDGEGRTRARRVEIGGATVSAVLQSLEPHHRSGSWQENVREQIDDWARMHALCVGPLRRRQLERLRIAYRVDSDLAVLDVLLTNALDRLEKGLI